MPPLMFIGRFFVARLLALLAAGAILPAAAQEPIKIAFSVSLAGGLASSGKAQSAVEADLGRGDQRARRSAQSSRQARLLRRPDQRRNGARHLREADRRLVRAIQATNPDVVLLASYPPDSVGMVCAATEAGLKTQLFGGAMVGMQYASLMGQLSDKLNRVVTIISSCRARR